jgi:hypothetical protein
MYYTVFQQQGHAVAGRQCLTHHITLTLCIYAYQRKGSVVYVGQTKQPLATRDQQHLCGHTVFDRDYCMHRKEYGPPFVLEKKIFEDHVSNLHEEAEFLRSTQNWMDLRETYWIRHHGTYTSSSGMNQTVGGQQGLETAYFLAHLKRREKIWKSQRMPLLRSSEFGVKRRLWETPQNYMWQDSPVGKFLNSLRSGERRIPICFLEELEELGYNGGKGYYHSRFELEYLPAFRSSSYGQRKRLWETPQNHVHAGIKIGKILNSLRVTGGLVFFEELNLLGYNNGKSNYESRFEVDIMEEFRTSAAGRCGRLWETPQNFVTDSGFRVGRVLNHLRMGTMAVPDSCKEELRILGYNDGKGFFHSRFEIDYLPVIEACPFGQQKQLNQIPRNYMYLDVPVGRLLQRVPILLEEKLRNLGWEN